MRSASAHRTYCYVCRQCVNRHYLRTMRYYHGFGWSKDKALCLGCMRWLEDVIELARGASIDWAKYD